LILTIVVLGVLFTLTISKAGNKWLSTSVNGHYKDLLTGMEFVFVKGGCFTMGDTFGDGYFAERPVHEVCVDDFYMGKYEVTLGEWTTIMGDGSPCLLRGERFPAGCVNYDDIETFMVKFSQRSGKRFRLPTEAEWEYACRSGGRKECYAGFIEKDHIFRHANFCDVHCNYDWVTGDQDDGHKDDAPVGSFLPNGLGIYDMSGNVWEWVSDWFDEEYYKNSPRKNPAGHRSGKDRVVRGGCWLNSPNYLRCSYRFGLNPALRENDVGFRVVVKE
jgi:formylglycine-generating enzyme required for sulfatase activity